MSRQRTGLVLALAVCAIMTGGASIHAQTTREQDTKTLISLLAQRVETQNFTHSMPLKDGIGLLYEKFAARKKELPIFINVGAYKTGEQAVSPYDVPVSLPYNVPRELPLQIMLEQYLAQMPEPSTFLIRQGYFEILPKPLARIHELLQRPIVASFEDQPLREALQHLSYLSGASINLWGPSLSEKARTTVSGTFRNNASLQDAIVILANQAGLKMVVLQNSVYVTTPENAAQIERDVPPQPVTTR